MVYTEVMNMALGNRISDLRKKNKMSQEELSSAMQVSRQAVSKWENDLSMPDTENLIRLAAILKVDVNELVDNPIPATESAPDRAPKHKTAPLICVICILLAISLCCNVVLIYRAPTTTQTATTTPTVTGSQTRWDSIVLLQGLVQRDVPLTEQDKVALADHIWNARYTTIDPPTYDKPVYGGPIAKVTFTRGDAICEWTYNSGYILYRRYIDETWLFCYYELTESERNWIISFLGTGE